MDWVDHRVVVCVVVTVAFVLTHLIRRHRSSRETLGNNAELANQLERLGLFKYSDPSSVPELKSEIVRLGIPGFFEEDGKGRAFLADAESLAEGGVATFLDQIGPFLRNQGVRIDSLAEDFGEQYAIKINGRSHILYSAQELREKEIWGLTPARTFAIVNGLLDQAGSPERLYTVNGGNDLLAVFLTAICMSSLASFRILASTTSHI